MNEGRGMKAGMDGCREERTEQKRLNVNERVKCRGVKGPFFADADRDGGLAVTDHDSV